MWKALHDVTKIDINSVMNDWVTYAGLKDYLNIYNVSRSPYYTNSI